MMMPANYSAIAENEMTYIVGGGLKEFLGSFTAPVFTVDNLKTLNTNIVTIIGNAYTQSLIDNTLGLVFKGYTGDATWANIKAGNVGTLIANQFSNKQYGDGVASILGTAAALYNLGQGATKNIVTNTQLSFQF